MEYQGYQISGPVGPYIENLKKQFGSKFTGFTYVKTFSTKVFGQGIEISEEQMQKINSFALVTLESKDIFVRKWLLAHNMIDRDQERFPEDLLDDFAKTLPGKNQLFGHSRPDPGKGLWFDAINELMTPEQFKVLTGEKVRLPENIEKVKILFAWAYMMKISANEETMANIDGGIYRHASIGFRATDIVAIKKDPSGPVLYWQYVGPGESTEGSLVWLGAQHGATSQKSLHVDGYGGNDPNLNKFNFKKGGKDEMEKLLKLLSTLCGKVIIDEDGAIENVKTMLDEKKSRITVLETDVSGRDEKIKTLEKESGEKDAKIKELTPLAADGKAYREELVGKYTSLKTRLEEIPADDKTKQEDAKKIAEGFPVEFLKSEVEALQKRIDEKFPEDSKLKGNDPDKERKGDEKKGRLVPEEDK